MRVQRHTLLSSGVDDVNTVTRIAVILELTRDSDVGGLELRHNIVAEVQRGGLPAGPAVI